MDVCPSIIIFLVPCFCSTEQSENPFPRGQKQSHRTTSQREKDKKNTPATAMSFVETLAQRLPIVLASDADFCFSSPEDAMVALGSSLNPSALADREQLLRHIETLTFHNQRMALALIAHTPNGQRLLDEFRSSSSSSCSSALEDDSTTHLRALAGSNAADSNNNHINNNRHNDENGDALVVRLDGAAQSLAFRHMRQANVRLGMFYDTMRERLAESQRENKKLEGLVLNLKARLDAAQTECSLAQAAETTVTAQSIEIQGLRRSEAELRKRVQLLESTAPTVTVVRGGSGGAASASHDDSYTRHRREEILEFGPSGAQQQQYSTTKNARTQTEEASVVYFSNTPYGSSGGSTAAFATAVGGAGVGVCVGGNSHHSNSSHPSSSIHSTSLVQCLLAEVEEEEVHARQRIAILSGNAPALRKRILALEIAGLEQAVREQENVSYANNVLYDAHRRSLQLEEDNAALQRTIAALEAEMERVSLESWRSTSEKLQNAMAQVRLQIQNRIDDAYLSGQQDALAILNGGGKNASSSHSASASSSTSPPHTGAAAAAVAAALCNGEAAAEQNKNKSQKAQKRAHSVVVAAGARPFSSASEDARKQKLDSSSSSSSSSESLSFGVEAEERQGEDIDDFAIRRHHRLSPRQSQQQQQQKRRISRRELQQQRPEHTGQGERLMPPLQQQSSQRLTTPRNNSVTSSSSSARRSANRPLQKQQQQQRQPESLSDSVKSPRDSHSTNSSSTVPKTISSAYSNNNQRTINNVGVPPLAMPPLALSQLRENLRMIENSQRNQQQQQHQQHQSQQHNNSNSARSHRSAASSSSVSGNRQPKQQQQQHHHHHALPFQMQSTNAQLAPSSLSGRKWLHIHGNADGGGSSSLPFATGAGGTASIGNMSSIDGGDGSSNAASDFEEIVL